MIRTVSDDEIYVIKLDEATVLLAAEAVCPDADCGCLIFIGRMCPAYLAHTMPNVSNLTPGVACVPCSPEHGPLMEEVHKRVVEGSTNDPQNIRATLVVDPIVQEVYAA